ncbi:MAG TPA: methyltransferase domain-containing protein, partial [Aquificaceae bacterium]|nr:methyltransferase domain-containing protein [Aquificaceae bacterium]
MRESGKLFPFFRGKVRIKQPKKHRVSVDLILFLSKLRGVKRTSRVMDLGAGFGFLSIVIAKRWGCCVHALERDPLMISFLKENVELNSLGGKVKVVEGDLREVGKVYERGSFEVVVSNPPFFPKDYRRSDGGIHFESDTSLADFISASSHLLRDGGYLNLLVPSFRLHETFVYLERYKLPPRFLSVMYPTQSKGGKLCVVVSRKNVPGPLELDRPLIINEGEGTYAGGGE